MHHPSANNHGIYTMPTSLMLTKSRDFMGDYMYSSLLGLSALYIEPRFRIFESTTTFSPLCSRVHTFTRIDLKNTESGIIDKGNEEHFQLNAVHNAGALV